MSVTLKSHVKWHFVVAALLFLKGLRVVVFATGDEARALEGQIQTPGTIVSRDLRQVASLGVPQELVALYQDYGEHYVDLWCGTPPQRQTLTVVTSSSESVGTNGFPCDGCKSGCGMENHIDNVFQESKSKTFKAISCSECFNGHCTTGGNQCQVGTTYPNGNSWRGFEAVDRCYIGGNHKKALKERNASSFEADDIDLDRAASMAFDLQFTCQTQVTGTQTKQMADGVLSMHNAPGSYLLQMYDAGLISDHKFSLCFRKVQDPNTSGSHAGAMTLGGADTRLHSSDMVLSLMDTKTAGYRVRMRKIHLRMNDGGDSANNSGEIRSLDLEEEDLNEHPILLDSAYRDTFLTASISTTLFSEWKKMTGASYSSYAKVMSEEERDALPTILFQLVGDEDYNDAVVASRNASIASGVIGLAGELDPAHPLDVIVAMPASHYIELEPGEESRYMGTISTSTKSEQGSVLGSNFMRGHDTLFNIDDQRLGWAESLCDYTDILEDYYNGVYGDAPSVSSNICSSWFCRVTLFSMLAAVAGGFAFIYLRRVPSIERSSYQRHPIELELTEAEQQREELVFSFD